MTRPGNENGPRLLPGVLGSTLRNASGSRRRLDDRSLAIVLHLAGKGADRPANHGPGNGAYDRHDTADDGARDRAPDGPADFFTVALADRDDLLLSVWLLSVWLLSVWLISLWLFG